MLGRRLVPLTGSRLTVNDPLPHDGHSTPPRSTALARLAGKGTRCASARPRPCPGPAGTGLLGANGGGAASATEPENTWGALASRDGSPSIQRGMKAPLQRLGVPPTLNAPIAALGACRRSAKCVRKKCCFPRCCNAAEKSALQAGKSCVKVSARELITSPPLIHVSRLTLQMGN